MWCSKNSLGMVHLSFALGITGTHCWCFFLQQRLRVQSTLAVGNHSSMHMCMDDSSTAIMWVAPHNKLLKISIKKEQKHVSIKKFLKRDLLDVGLAQCMNALADKVHKQEVPCTQWYTLHDMATLFNNYPYIVEQMYALEQLLRLVHNMMIAHRFTQYHQLSSFRHYCELQKQTKRRMTME